MSREHNRGGTTVNAIKGINKRYTPFVRGYMAARAGKPLKLGELIYSHMWEQIAFERGWAFGRQAARAGLRLILHGRELPREAYTHIYSAVRHGVLI